MLATLTGAKWKIEITKKPQRSSTVALILIPISKSLKMLMT